MIRPHCLLPTTDLVERSCCTLVAFETRFSGLAILSSLVGQALSHDATRLFSNLPSSQDGQPCGGSVIGCFVCDPHLGPLGTIRFLHSSEIHHLRKGRSCPSGRPRRTPGEAKAGTGNTPETANTLIIRGKPALYSATSPSLSLSIACRARPDAEKLASFELGDE